MMIMFSRQTIVMRMSWVKEEDGLVFVVKKRGSSSEMRR
jgi:hypothetical protein